MLSTLLLSAILAQAPPNLLDRDWTSTIHFGKEGIACIARVEKKGDKYLYTYRIKNDGEKKTWIVAWPSADTAAGLWGRDDTGSHFWELKPGQEASLTVLHDDPPVEFLGMVNLYSRESPVKGWAELLKRTGAAVNTPPLFHFCGSGGTNCLMPKSRVPKARKAS